MHRGRSPLLPSAPLRCSTNPPIRPARHPALRGPNGPTKFPALAGTLHAQTSLLLSVNPPDHNIQLATEALGNGTHTTDVLPATYHYHTTARKRAVGDPVEDISAFLGRELSLGELPGLQKHLWFAGAARPAMPLHSHVARGREIVVLDQMDMHLLWANEGRLFIKPVPRFLLSPDFCRNNLQCLADCTCQDPLAHTCRATPRRVALGFLYTYACLISSETDFHLANEKRLLPRKDHDELIAWSDWTALARELLHTHAHDPALLHPRFHRAELRLSRINTLSRLTRLRSYTRGRHSYGSFFRAHLAWISAATVFVAVVLGAMQVGLATDRLQGDAAFQQASYGFAVFAILAPVGVFVLAVLRAGLHLARDLPLLLGVRQKRAEPKDLVKVRDGQPEP